jgi:hypothetical protein
VEWAETIGRAGAFAFAAGINLYAAVAILGLASRFGWVELPAQFDVFNNDWVIGAALVMYVVEFVADKVPWVDSMWDSVHTAIRPVGGAVIAMTAIGDAGPAIEGLAALLGGTLAAGTHLTKASTRAVANTSPEPFSNWALSFGEDAFVIGLAFLALQYPIAALAVVATLSLLIVLFIATIVRWARRRWKRRT